ncbi:MAG: AsnC family protein [Gammaproteobacteria bacterium]
MNARWEEHQPLAARAALIEAIQEGLPLTPRPYAALGERLGMNEADVIAALQELLAEGVIKRFGVVVRHRDLGYRANAMVVWDAPDDAVDDLGRRFQTFAFVTLCYRRPRRPPDWPYNLFCMIHGRSRSEVEADIALVLEQLRIGHLPRAVLFSRRCFKQCGARFAGLPQRAP